MSESLPRDRLKRIHALTGVVPLGAFLVLHLGGNATALWGRARFEEHVARVDGMTGRGLLEVAFVVLPLLVHVALGARLLLERPRVDAPDGPRDWGRALQRATGLLALVFIAVHLGHYRMPRAMGELGPTDLYDAMATDLSGMGRFAFYLAGTSAVVFHFAHGLVRFGADTVRRGAPLAPARRRRLVLAAGAAGVALWLVALEVLGHFYAGGSFAGTAGLLGRLSGGEAAP